VVIIEIYSITWIAVISILIVLILIIILYYFVLLHDKKIIEKNSELIEQEKKFHASIITAGEMERKSISRDLHDNVGMLISTVKLKIDSEIDNLHQKKIDTGNLRSCEPILEKIYESLKNITTNLSPPRLINFGLFEGISYLSEEINQTGIHTVEVTNYNWIESVINENENENIYFIIKELINNSIKHKNAKKTTIEMISNSNSKVIKIRNDVEGITDDQVKSVIEKNGGNGLKNIFGRLLLINGKINFNNDVNNKTKISITLDK
jgi:two-component system NarL family sensor kinase